MSRTPRRIGTGATVAVTLIILAMLAATGWLIRLCIDLANTDVQISETDGDPILLPTAGAAVTEPLCPEPEAAAATVPADLPPAPAETEAAMPTVPLESEPVAVTAENWKQAYHDFIIKDVESSEYAHDNNVNYFSYHLIYLNEDEIPELWINYAITAAGCRLVTVADGDLYNTLLGCGWLSYTDYRNTFCHRYGKTGDPTVYSLEHGSLIELGSGSQYGDEYFWDEAAVSKEVYEQKLNQYVDPGAAKDTIWPEYTYSEILEYLSDEAEN
nr:hypothetical protein [Oscillospiraceae bacterium]